MFHVPAHKSADAGSVSNIPFAPGSYVLIDGKYVPILKRVEPIPAPLPWGPAFWDTAA